MANKIAVIVAGGKGRRMMSDVPKQFLLLNNKPVLMHTIEAFARVDKQMEIVLVLPADDMHYWQSLCEQHSFGITHRLVAGGAERFGSVLNALNTIDLDSGIVAIHDGVRPLVSNESIARCFAMAHARKTAIPVVDAVDSLRMMSDGGSVSVDRSKYKMVQTPQVFDLQLLKAAYACHFNPLFTDDASVVESYLAQQTTDIKIELVDGNRENIKITSPMDIAIAECLLSLKKI